MKMQAVVVVKVGIVRSGKPVNEEGDNRRELFDAANVPQLDLQQETGKELLLFEFTTLAATVVACFTHEGVSDDAGGAKAFAAEREVLPEYLTGICCLQSVDKVGTVFRKPVLDDGRIDIGVEVGTTLVAVDKLPT
ncbi:hypothetical protein SAMN04487926_16022 [Paraburkholderia steynii]|uniref:Uncharacterized protein n=1 Tax=Paraburkholderia steynii TaxID=1245441 RepID=A0A7Z7BLT0_9BURK|nr:hypothetical protein [Paraburkholderia steynii]SDJ53889.1 hypothetical protein SAMN04487926_16022 [Paraburkholderia steynii]